MDERCKVFTPSDVIEYMLDLIDYKKNVFGKTIIDNSCGEGNILCAIVCRYIEDLSGKEINLIKEGLERDIVGFDIDEDCCKRTIENLDKVALRYGLSQVNWNVHCKDTLKQNDCETYDFVVGNPPYISYRMMDKDTRNSLKTNFSSCKKGAYDYCYAFIEHSLASLKKDGKMVYLVPSSIFKNVHGKALRNLMIDELTEVHDYGVQKLFEKILTSSALILCDKSCHSRQLKYRDMSSKTDCAINKKNLCDKWVFEVEERQLKEPARFGDYFRASMPIATLLNSAFVVSKSKEDKDRIYIKDKIIERDAVKKAASPRQLHNGTNEYIIFPYTYGPDGELLHYTEEAFCEKYPLAFEYLKGYKNELLKRDADPKALWFEYGRSQALQCINQEKLLLSTVITEKVEVYALDEMDIPYAGIMISKRKDISLRIAKEILLSNRFLCYVKAIGTHVNGSSIRITPRDIENFQFEKTMLEYKTEVKANKE